MKIKSTEFYSKKLNIQVNSIKIRRELDCMDTIRQIYCRITKFIVSAYFS